MAAPEFNIQEILTSYSTMIYTGSVSKQPSKMGEEVQSGTA